MSIIAGYCTVPAGYIISSPGAPHSPLFPHKTRNANAAMRASSPQLHARLADPPLHIATPPVYRAASLFDVEWNSTPPQTQEHHLEARWNTGVAGSVPSGVARQQRVHVNTLPAPVANNMPVGGHPRGLTRFISPDGSVQKYEGSVHGRSSTGNHHVQGKHYVQPQREGRALPNQLRPNNGLPHNNKQHLAQGCGIAAVDKLATRLFDTSNLSKLKPKDKQHYGNAAKKRMRKMRKTQGFVFDDGVPKKAVPRQYEGFSEKTVLLLTATSASDFVRESHAIRARKLSAQESAKHEGSLPDPSKTDLPVQNGPIWGRDAYYRQPERYRNIPGRNVPGCASTNRSRSSRRRRAGGQKTGLKKRLEILSQTFNVFMDVSTTHPLAFRRVTTARSTPNLLLDDHPRQIAKAGYLAPVHAAGRHVLGLRDSILKSVQSRSCGLSLLEIEKVTSRTSKMRPGGTQSLPTLQMSSSAAEPRREDMIIDVPIVPGELEHEIYKELRTRQRSRQSSSRQASRRISAS